MLNKAPDARNSDQAPISLTVDNEDVTVDNNNITVDQEEYNISDI